MDFRCNWPFPPADLFLPGDDVHIWCASLDQPDTVVEQMAQSLSTEESKRAGRFRFRQHRNQFILTHGILRKLLADYTDIEAAGITFSYGKNGKPYLPERFNQEKIRFNMSHSNGYALFGFTRNREIGVDIEHICELADMENVAKQVFSTKEMAVLRSTPAAEKKEVFFKFWTRKEAYIKGVGEGFSSPLDSIDISAATIGEPICVQPVANPASKNLWIVQDLRPLPGFAAAFAAEGDCATPHCWRIPNSFIQTLDKNG